jgi:exosortase E/protease (VPEID-CTERM system)
VECFGLPSVNACLPSRRLVRRILSLTFLFVSELIPISFWLDSDSLAQRTGLIGGMHDWGTWILRYIVGFAAMFLSFAYLRNRSELNKISDRVGQMPIRWSFVVVHCSAMIFFVGLSFLLYVRGGSGSPADLLAASWFVAGISAIAFGAFAFLSWAVWVQLIRGTGYLWCYASTATALACLVGGMIQSVWQPASSLTYRLTKMFLSPFVSGIIANQTTLTIGTPHFQVQIAPQCSGLEGVGLILAFTIVWLLLFRQECRFPQSLILIPLGVTLIFLLNSLRIATLVLIGNAGDTQIALDGFHSQAGWIAFVAVAAGFCFAIQRIPWFTRRQTWGSLSVATQNPTAAFLLPFMVILAVGMIARAAGDADSLGWLHPLGFLAVFGVLWTFRHSYASLNWRCDRLGPAMGAAAFVVWVGLSHFSRRAFDPEVSVAWLASSQTSKLIWAALAAVITIPLAEELAFRGFLMRRLLSQDFESVSLQRFSWFALLVSSVTFGLLQGGHWVGGTIVGILFGLAAIRRGRIGDAMVAHATANALLMAYILAYRNWHLW